MSFDFKWLLLTRQPLFLLGQLVEFINKKITQTTPKQNK